MEDNAFNAEAERERTDYILNTILYESAHAYSEVLDCQIDADEFVNQMQIVKG